MPPQFSLDVTQPEAHLRLLAFLVWHTDEERQANALASHYLDRRANLERTPTQAAIRLITAEAWKQVASSVEPSALGAATISSPEVVDEIARLHIENGRKMLEERLLMPAGGWEVVDRAGWPAEKKAIERFAPKVRLVGRILSFVYILDMHHSKTLPASLNRALAIAAAEMPGFNRRSTIDSWKQLRSIAPLCAALDILFRDHADAGSKLPFLEDPEGLGTLLGYAKGLRTWATHFNPQRGQGALIPEAEAVIYDVATPERRPDLEQLTNSQRKAARRPSIG